jgi:hypothetical protein
MVLATSLSLETLGYFLGAFSRQGISKGSEVPQGIALFFCLWCIYFRLFDINSTNRQFSKSNELHIYLNFTLALSTICCWMLRYLLLELNCVKQSTRVYQIFFWGYQCLLTEWYHGRGQRLKVESISSRRTSWSFDRCVVWSHSEYRKDLVAHASNLFGDGTSNCFGRERFCLCQKWKQKQE